MFSSGTIEMCAPAIVSAVCRPLVVELFAGCFGWSAGWLELGGRAVGFDIEHLPHHGPVPENATLVLQDARTLHGRQFNDASLILASPPCQEFSFMAMPFRRGKQIAAALRGQGEFPERYTGSRTIEQLTALFDACFRIQREASEAAGRYIPMVVENVKGAQPWVGPAKAHFGSFYLWGDVANVGGRIVAGVPRFGGSLRVGAAQKANPDGTEHGPGSWFNIAHNTESGCANNPVSVPASGERDGVKVGGAAGDDWFAHHNRDSFLERAELTVEGLKRPGRSISEGFNNWPKDENGLYVLPDGTKQGGSGPEWFDNGIAKHSSRSAARKAASAQIARIPLALSRYVAQAFCPTRNAKP